MSKMDDFIAKNIANDPEFAEAFAQEDLKLKSAVLVRDTRANMNMSQRQFADLIGKPQSTVARIENGSLTPSMTTLADIAKATNQRLDIRFEPVSQKETSKSGKSAVLN